jgi:GNAT superfamily N-acetyltransferase
MDVHWKRDDDEHWLSGFLEREWGGTTMVVHDEEIPMLPLPTLIAGEREGIAIIRDGDPADLVLLHVMSQNAGIGTALLTALSDHLRARGVKTLRVTTTNDNLEALRFYQRRGFRLRTLRSNAVEAARRLKPSIPLIAQNGIPISDALDLELDLTRPH